MEKVRTSLIGVAVLSVTVTVTAEALVLFRIIAITQVVAAEVTKVELVGTAARVEPPATALPQEVLGIVLTVPITFVPAGIAAASVALTLKALLSEAMLTR